jgi:hypothetical protein
MPFQRILQLYYIDIVHGINHRVGARVRQETVVTDIRHSSLFLNYIIKIHGINHRVGARVRQETVVTVTGHPAYFSSVCRWGG